ncbi:TonB-dependent receptor [Flavihumibacter sp. R14]|nr:TonB-dependent receptor [Flavihumibacter soli]
MSLTTYLSAQSIDPSLSSNFQVTGTIIDSKSSQPVDFATVSLFLGSATQPAKVVQSGLDGGFKISNIVSGTYVLKISFLGYQPYVSDSLKLTSANPSKDFGTIKLLPAKSTVLNEVVVEAERSNIQLGIDRKVFSVNQSLVSEGGSATDLLANVPSVSVDVDGNVNLRGTSNVRVLIDGKPSSIGGGNITQVLQSLPASAIESIELVTNPSSKYDPEGQSGIINIVLKKNRKVGLNGSVSASAGSYDNYNASTNLSYRDGKVNLYGNYSFRNGNRLGDGFNNTEYLESGIVNNVSESARNDVNNTLKLGAEYFINPKTTIGLSGNFNVRDNSGLENLDYLYSNFINKDGSSFRTSNRDGNSSGYDLSLDLSRDFQKKGHGLTANFSFGQSSEDDQQQFHQEFFATTGQRDSMDRRINENSEFDANYNIQIDYSLPITGKQKFEAGFRTNLRKSDESQYSEVFSTLNNEFNVDYGQSNDFDLDDQVYAVYSTYQNQITKTFGFQAGLRTEQAYLNTQYRGLGTASNNVVEGKLDYLRVYPSVFLTQKLTNDQQLQLSYSRRVNRPRGWQINPFADMSDPNNIRVGNPGLKPEDIHSFELSYIKYLMGLTFTSSAYFRQVNDVVEGIRKSLPDNNSATITEFFNLTSNQSSGLELISKADFSKSFSLTSNLNLFYSRFKGNEEFDIKSSDGFTWNANLTGNIVFPKNITAQFNGSYRAPRIGAQGRSKEMYGLDAALRLEVLKNKAGSISFNMRDIFNSRKWGQTTETAFFIQESERRMQGRMATLTFSYRFGKQDINLRKRNNKDQQDEPRSEEEL